MCRSGDGCENWSKYDCPEKTKRQLATYPSAANESARMRSSSAGAANTPAYTTMPTITRNSAGSSRRARRTQNALRSMRPRPAHSVTSNDVMRKPLNTKKVSTPMNPPIAHD